MSIYFNGNVTYEGIKPFTKREQYQTKQEMLDANKLSLNSGLIAYCIEDKKHYKFIRENDSAGNENTGSWVELSPNEVNGAVTQAIATAKSEAIADAESKYVKKSEEKQVVVESQNLQHVIKFGGQTVGTINIPKDLFVTAFEYVADQKKLRITVNNSDGSGTPMVQEVNVSDFVQTYTNGTGLQLNAGQFSLTAEMAGLPAKVTTLEGKVSSLEARDAWLLGFTQTGNKYAVKHEDKKLYVEVPVPEVPEIEKATAQKDGLMSKEHFAKVEGWKERLFVVTEAEFNQMKNSQTLVTDGIYFIREN